VHRVKGLEWPHVVVYDASFTVFPHRLSVDVEEERRVFHVAITRCTASLVVTAEAESPSIFLDELDAPASALAGEVRAPATRDSNPDVRGANPATAEVGLEFKWGGYEFTVREVNPDGVVVSTGDSRTTVLPFGWTITVGGQTRTLVGPKAVKSGRAVAGPASQADADIYNALKSWRLEQSRADNVPAYVIFNDRTLEEISSVRPSTVGELLSINGIGPSKVDRYGDQILAITEQSTPPRS
jgi:hypothetical protein